MSIIISHRLDDHAMNSVAIGLCGVYGSRAQKSRGMLWYPRFFPFQPLVKQDPLPVHRFGNSYGRNSSQSRVSYV